MLGYDTFPNKLVAVVVSGAICAAAGAAYARAVRLCRLDLRLGAVFDPAAAVGAARRRRHHARAARRHAVHVLCRRRHQRLHLGLSADRRRRADPAGAVLPEGHARHDARPLAAGGCHDAAARPRKGSAAISAGCKRRRQCRLHACCPARSAPLIGPNGAGKTTFVSLVCGRLQPSSGTIVFDGEDITGLPAHRRVRLGIAYTFQITSVFANLTAYDNVALAVQRTLTTTATRRGARAFSRRHRRRSSAPALPTAPAMLAGQLVLWPPAAAGGRHGPGAEAAPADPRRADARACPTARSTISSRWCARSPGRRPCC